MIDVTGTRVEVEATVLAPPEVVWDLIADITRIPGWSPECVHTAWLGQVSPTPRVGDRFTGHNRARNGFEWDVTCEITEADRPRTFAWVVLARPDAVSSYWCCELEPLQSGTRVHESFRHGPGGSGLRAMVGQSPDQAAGLIEERRRQLRENITTTLAAMKAVAESG
jgi:uncharacterized protein YndB with AHSA1/START domain